MNRSITAKQFAARMEEAQAKFYRLAFCYVKNEHDALEILSEATYRGFINLKRLEKPEFFDTWMSRIIINCACDFLKKQNRYDFHEPDDSLPARQEELSVDDRLDLYQALDELAPDEKSLIILKYFEDKSFREIASILNIPESTVKTRLYRIIGKLRDAIRA
ncbi:MAG TPA: sigma-70 family RNA polymerase sigma factor [Candidatus Eisenbergiella merdavium]|uniref:Sigma-70 family RNA polymerase sigma factor n=1 Tax=Candidatus Eisenbergiella merdavium TaxID=2838551 RepID=A0A9D2SPX1_9FIRM|nr:sigma-70 family RNA polymerase sigma factor [Candidatus Eisenbergiella merdavium]